MSAARYISTNETAVLMRTLLKKKFPGVKFSVRGKKYSGGSSITVEWTDGPLASQVDAVISPFAGSGFVLTMGKHYPGCYRVRRADGAEIFGQIKKFGRKWRAEIRNTDTGNLVREAGIWPTLNDARDEVEWIILRSMNEAA